MKFREYINNDSAYQIVALTLDQCVYDKDRATRMINQSTLTTKEPRVSTIDSDHDIQDTCVCNVREWTGFFKVPPKWFKSTENPPLLLRPNKR